MLWFEFGSITLCYASGCPRARNVPLWFPCEATNCRLANTLLSGALHLFSFHCRAFRTEARWPSDSQYLRKIAQPSMSCSVRKQTVAHRAPAEHFLREVAVKRLSNCSCVQQSFVWWHRIQKPWFPWVQGCLYSVPKCSRFRKLRIHWWFYTHGWICMVDILLSKKINWGEHTKFLRMMPLVLRVFCNLWAVMAKERMTKDLLLKLMDEVPEMFNQKSSVLSWGSSSENSNPLNHWLSKNGVRHFLTYDICMQCWWVVVSRQKSELLH